MSRPFITTITAVATSSILIHTISTDPVPKYGAISINRLETFSRQLPALGAAFSNLQTLKLNLREWKYPEDGFELSSTAKTSFVVRFLAKCGQVRVLGLSGHSSFEEHLFAEIAKHCKFTNLQACSLELFSISSVTDLSGFLTPAKDTLQNLALRRSVLRDEQATWADVMRRLALYFDLQSLAITDVFTRLGARMVIDETVKSSIILEAPDLAEKLEHHAERLVRGNRGSRWHVASGVFYHLGMRI